MFVADSEGLPIYERPQRPYTHIVQGTVANNITAGSWQNQEISLTNNLPAGEYQMLGGDVVSNGGSLFAARFQFKDYTLKPAIIPSNDVNQTTNSVNQYWGEEYSFYYPDNLCNLECLSGATTTVAYVTLYLSRLS